MSGATYTYDMESEIRVYGSSWKPKIGDFLLTDREVSNEDDKFAVAVYEELGNRWEENCWTFTNGIQQNCILFYRERW